MKMNFTTIKTSLLLLILIASVSITVNGQVTRWYISATGNNANNGMTPATAWRQMQFANDNALVKNGDTIMVLAGNYAENVVVSKSLKFYGPNFITSPNTQTRVAEAIITMSPNVFEAYTPGTSVEVKGFKLSGGSPIYDENRTRTSTTPPINILFEKNFVSGASNLFSGSLSVWRTISVIDNYFENINLTPTSSAIQINTDATVTILDNRINGTAFAGILLDAVASATVSNNTIRNTPNEAAIQLAGAIGNALVSQNDIQFANSAAGADAGGIRIFGSAFTGSVRIINNVVKNARNGFAVANGQNITGKNIVVNNNYFDGSNTSYAIYNGGTGNLNATCNLNSTTTPPVAAKIFGSVLFQPYLTSAGDSDPAMPGFQPALGTCNGFDPALPVTIASVKAYSKNAGIQVEWTVVSEYNIDRYEVEKSLNGRQFTKSGSLNSTRANSNVTNYNWYDPSPATGVNYYRIAIVDKDSKVRYTQTVAVKTGKGLAGISVYPNPVVGNQFVLQMNNTVKGIYTLSLINKLGQQVFVKTIQSNTTSGTQTIEIGNIAAGTYQLKIIGGGSTFVQQIIKTN